MTKKLAGKELVAFRQLLMSNSIKVDSLAQILIDKGVINEQEFIVMLRKVQADYQRRQRRTE